MASTTLYPPIVDSYTSAFIASWGDGICKVYFSLSKFSSSVTDIQGIHCLITNQRSGENMVNRKKDDAENGRYRTGGVLIIQNTSTRKMIHKEGENLYYIEILPSDIMDYSENGGWTESWVYKIQVRFSKVIYEGAQSGMGQAAWLNDNANQFSEWSNYTITKAIPAPVITIPVLNYNSENVEDNLNMLQEYNIFSSTLDFSGTYSNKDDSENLYSYTVNLKDTSGKLLETSGLIYANQYIANQFKYIFKTELEDSTSYDIELEYETINKYKDTITIRFTVQLFYSKIRDIKLLTAEDPQAQPYTSVRAEEEDGRIGLKLYYEDDTSYFGNVCIRRTDSRSNFSIWDDIAFISIVVADGMGSVNDLPIVYDYTAESGVWYQYGLQFIDADGYRSPMVKHYPIKREYDYSFLLGENNKQLRLEYNNTMNSFKTAVSDSKMDTVGGQYPFITRNGNMKYKTFPINGLISFNMDDNNLFTDKLDIYKYQEVVDLYDTEEFSMYDYTYERDFRNKVMDFLQDGKPKLFKSPTEGNVIVRLMDVNTTPDAKLGRLISSFSSTAYEIATADMGNYKKYKFCNVGELEDNIIITDTRFGQLDINAPLNQNLIPLILEKYDRTNILGTKETVLSIDDISIIFEGEKANIQTRTTAPGYVISSTLSGAIKVFSDFYNFGHGFVLDRDDNLSITQAGEDPVHIIINFTYTVQIQEVSPKRVVKKNVSESPGQICKTMVPGETLFNQIYFMYYYDWDLQYRIVQEVTDITITANEGTIFDIIDSSDKVAERFIMNETGVLHFDKINYINDIKYVGRYIDIDTFDLNESGAMDVAVNYIVKLEEGEYVQ